MMQCCMELKKTQWVFLSPKNHYNTFLTFQETFFLEIPYKEVNLGTEPFFKPMKIIVQFHVS